MNSWKNIYIGYMLINLSRDVFVSLACYSYSKSVRLREGSSSWWKTISMEMSHHIFLEVFRIKIRAQASTLFSLRIFLYYIDTHVVLERKMYSIALMYFQGCKYRGWVKCLWECELMRGPLPWMLLYIPLMWNVCAL